jgi:hypothetical protein
MELPWPRHERKTLASEKSWRLFFMLKTWPRIVLAYVDLGG